MGDQVNPQDLLSSDATTLEHDPIQPVTLSPPRRKFDEIIEVADDDPNKEEAIKLGNKGSLRTILVLMIGPLISQLVSALYGVIDSMWVGKALGPHGMSAVSVFSNLENIGRAFGFFLSTSASSQISYLFGQGLGEEAGQLIADLIRSAFVCGAFVSLILLPSSKPLGRWFGADEKLTNDGFAYLCPILACSFISCIYLLLCGCLQAEGRTFVVAALQITSLILNMCVFDPLFLLGVKMGTPGAALATILSEAIPTLGVLFFYFRGKFGVKPKLNMLLKKFSKRTIPAMRVGLSQLFANLSRSIPSIFLRKFMGLCAEKMPNATFEDAAVGFNAVTRIFGITDAVRLATCMSYLPTASYAYSRKKFKRFLYLCLHTSWVNLLWGVGTCLFTAFGPQYVAMSISSDPTYLKWASPMLQKSNWEAPIAWVRNVCQTSLQAMQLGRRATLYSFFATFVIYIAIATILYYTNDHDFIRLMYVFPLTSVVSMVAAIFWMFKPIRDMARELRSALSNPIVEQHTDSNDQDENTALKPKERKEQEEGNRERKNSDLEGLKVDKSGQPIFHEDSQEFKEGSEKEDSEPDQDLEEKELDNL